MGHSRPGSRAGRRVRCWFVLLGFWCLWTAGRLDRMHLRVEAARASLLTQLRTGPSVATELAIGGLEDPASALLLMEPRVRHARRRPRGAEHWLAESELTAVTLALDLPSPDREPLVSELADPHARPPSRAGSTTMLPRRRGGCTGGGGCGGSTWQATPSRRDDRLRRPVRLRTRLTLPMWCRGRPPGPPRPPTSPRTDVEALRFGGQAGRHRGRRGRHGR